MDEGVITGVAMEKKIPPDEVCQDNDQTTLKEIKSQNLQLVGDGDEDKNNIKAENDISSSNPSQPDHLQSLCIDMFSKISQYMSSEVATTLEDYKLLERMNVVTMEKYDSMLEMAKSTGNNLHSLNQKLSDLQPYLDLIETIETKVIALEQAAYKLDAYSKRLEERFKRTEKH